MIRGYSVTKLPEALRNSARNGVLDHRNRSLFGVLFEPVSIAEPRFI